MSARYYFSTFTALAGMTMTSALVYSTAKDIVGRYDKVDTKNEIAINEVNTILQNIPVPAKLDDEYIDRIQGKLASLDGVKSRLDNAKALPIEERPSAVISDLTSVKIQFIEKRLENLESERVTAWTYVKAILAWFLASFFGPLVSGLGKKFAKEWAGVAPGETTES